MANRNGVTDSELIRSRLGNPQQKVELMSTQLGNFISQGTGGHLGGASGLIVWIAKLFTRGLGMIFYLFIHGPIRYILLSYIFTFAVYGPLVYIFATLFHRPIPFVFDPLFINSGLASFYSSLNVSPGLLMGIKTLLSPLSYLISFYTSLTELQYQPLSVAILILSTFPLFVSLELLTINSLLIGIAGINLTVTLHQLYLGVGYDFTHGNLMVNGGYHLFSLIVFNLCALNYFLQPVFLRQMRNLHFNALGEPPARSFADLVTGNNLFKSPIRWK